MAMPQLPLLRVTESLLLPAVSTTVRTPAAAPALALMTDFLVTPAVGIAASASLGEAESRLLECDVDLLIVLVESCCVMGVIDVRDLRGERIPMVRAQSDRVPDEPRVVDRLAALRELDVLSLTTLSTATPLQVEEALRRSGRDHLLVIEPSGTDLTGRLRGVVSLAQVEQRARATPPATSLIT